MQKCPYCGGENFADAKKCKFCGKSLDTSVMGAAQSSSITGPKTSGDSVGVYKTYLLSPIFGHYADFKGSMSRKAYWMWILLSNVAFMSVFTALACIDFMLGFAFSGLWYLVTIIPSLAAFVRRMHDIGKSGWWLFIGMVPLVGMIWLLILLCKRGRSESIVAKWKVADTIATLVIAILVAVGIGIAYTDEGDSADRTIAHVNKSEGTRTDYNSDKSSFNNNADSDATVWEPKVSTKDSNRKYYFFDDTEWEPNADASLWLAVATTDKRDVECDRQGYIDRIGDLTIVAVETPVDEKATPVLSASQIAAYLNKRSSSDVFLSFTTSDDDPSLIYINYMENGAEFGYSGYMNIRTGKFEFTREEMY